MILFSDKNNDISNDNDCINEINLNQISPFVLLSPNYPNMIKDKINCTINVITDSSIRVLLYDFDFSGKFTINGIDYITRNKTTKNYNGYQTISKSIPSYYYNNITLDYYCDESLDLPCNSRFYIILNKFNNG